MERLLNAKVEPGAVAVHWLGQGGFALKAHAGERIIVDPYLTDSANGNGDSPRMVPVPIKPKEVPCDFLFLTHDHVDHLDTQTAPVIAQHNPDAVIVCPPSVCRRLVKLGVPQTQITSVMPGDKVSGRGFTAHTLPAHHTEDSVGFVWEFSEEGAETAGPVVCITGDTEWWDGLAACIDPFGPDILCVPINGKWGNMSAGEAAKLAAEVAPREVIPMHYGMFAQNTADPNEFVSLLAAATGGDPTIAAVVMGYNTCHVLHADSPTHGRKARQEARRERAKTGNAGREHHDGVRGGRH